jgi:hypothetical protein
MTILTVISIAIALAIIASITYLMIGAIILALGLDV